MLMEFCFFVVTFFHSDCCFLQEFFFQKGFDFFNGVSFFFCSQEFEFFIFNGVCFRFHMFFF